MKLKNKTLLQQLTLAFTPLALFALAPQAHSADSFTEAITGGKVSANLQYRYENVDQNNASLNAKASTLRLRLGYETAEYMGFGGMVQIEHVSANDTYNSRANGQTQYSVVADPKGTEINQAYISYSGVPQTKIKYGRQVITLDNHRWVGNVVWRQNWQTYDGLSAVNQSLPDTTITAAVITNANRVFGDGATNAGGTPSGGLLGDHHMKSTLLNANYKGLGFAEVVGYGYFLDYDPSALAFGQKNSTRTLGIRFKGTAPVSDYKLLYTAEYASQSDYKDNPSDYRVHYTLLEGGMDFKVATVKLGYELLSGNGTNSLSTPLATLFAFNGWADVFLATPANGLQDVYLNARTNVMGVVVGADYHDFRSDVNSIKYGKELDLIAEKDLNKTYSVGSRYARFRADSQATSVNCGASCVDTNKLWIYGSMKF